ncbi:HK97 family phage prohead protease [Xinfangfangia sp. D13-10-4-6]|uniref:HK97 family phage prohead protease n=1 Tax=Pseudogemmobacter hezensis TaxID=2737662 RepID=UPI0015564ECB|nr:HK97 family phage prohead protease [Pseudogemmobacter hezensis]NPD15752.1 HK97 family phage prohead protease [Pseudogemmobacter hezensis]
MTTKPEAEKRSLVLPVERRAGEDGKVTVAGYAAVFGEVTSIGGYFDEVLARGAFTKTLKTADVLAYFDHDRGRILGRSISGTLRLTEDDKGLAVEIDLPDTSDGRDVRTLIERGDIRGMSFGFRVTREEWDETGTTPKRTIHEVELREVSIVSEPAYDGTSIALRSLDEARKERRAQNFTAAERRVSARRANAEARFRGII